MRTLIAVSIAVLMGLAVTVVYARDKWVAYYFPVIAAMAPEYQGNSAETFDAGGDVLDAPAGKHGFCVVVGAHFYFTDGPRARFWGTNLCGDACFPGREQAELMASRIAYFGFNAVRLTEMSDVLTPKKVLEQLDKLDYLVYQLKKQGVYVNLNTFAGLDKPACLFDPELIALQKEYARALLGHVNPYTKLKYSEEPAVCMVEINDNVTLAGLEPAKLDARYRAVYDGLMDKWLDESGRRELYENGYSVAPDLRDWEMEKHGGAMMKTRGEDEVTLYVTRTSSKAWHLQYCATGLRLRKGQEYVLRFAAKADRPVKISAEAQQHYIPWKNLGLDESFELTDEFRDFEARFTAAQDCNNCKLGFVVGYAVGDVTIKGAVLQEDWARQKIRDFNEYLEMRYLIEMREFMHGELGVRVPVGVGGSGDPRQEWLQQEALDYVDRQAFWDRPVFPGEPGDMDNFRIQDRSIFTGSGEGVLGVFGSKKEKRAVPHTVSAWAHCYPNKYAYETPLLLAERANERDWDALFQYAYSHGGGTEQVYDAIRSFYDTNANAQQLMLGAFGARIFLGPVMPKDKAAEKLRFGITKSDAVVKFGRRTVRIGQIRNTDSGWNLDGTYTWGTAPTLLDP